MGLKEIPYLGFVITRGGITLEPKRVQGIIDLDRPSATTKVRELIGMFQYYRDMWPRRSHILAPLTEAARGPKGRTIFWNEALEIYFKELKCMVSLETLLSYTDCNLPFTVHTDASDKQLGAVISKNKKPIDLFSRKLINPQRNYTTTKKELLAIVECLK